MLPTVVERARKNALKGAGEEGVKKSETNTKARHESLTLDEGYHEVGGEETRGGGAAATNTEVYQELLEENRFGSSLLPTATLVERVKNKMAQSSQREEQVGTGSDSGGVMGHIVPDEH